MEIGSGDFPGSQRFAQGQVLRMAGKALTKNLEGLLHSAAEIAKRTGTLLVSGLRPLSNQQLFGCSPPRGAKRVA